MGEHSLCQCGNPHWVHSGHWTLYRNSTNSDAIAIAIISCTATEHCANSIVQCVTLQRRSCTVQWQLAVVRTVQHTVYIHCTLTVYYTASAKYKLGYHLVVARSCGWGAHSLLCIALQSRGCVHILLCWQKLRQRAVYSAVHCTVYTAYCTYIYCTVHCTAQNTLHWGWVVGEEQCSARTSLMYLCLQNSHKPPDQGIK